MTRKRPKKKRGPFKDKKKIPCPLLLRGGAKELNEKWALKASGKRPKEVGTTDPHGV